MGKLIRMLVGTAIGLLLLGVLMAVFYYAIDWTGAVTYRWGIGQAWGAGLASVLMIQMLFVMVLATLLTLAERKWSAAMQDRIGPNRARIDLPFFRTRAFGGIPHIIADALKMLSKEDHVPGTGARFLYHLGPILNFAPIFCLFAIVPMGPPVGFQHLIHGQVVKLMVTPQIANPEVGLLYLFGIASLAVYGVALAGWASGNKLALLGGVRASSQMISYEVSLGLGLVGMMMLAGTLRLDQMVESQSEAMFGLSWLPSYGIFLQPVGFLLFFASAFAETKRAPFDLPEGESEIIGYFIEYSGMKFGMFMIAEFIEVVTLAGVLTAVFFGGYHLTPGLEGWLRASVVGPLVHWRFPGPLNEEGSVALTMAVIGATVFVVKVVVLCWLQLAIRWTLPRFRYDQIQKLGWRLLLPLGLVNVFATGLCMLLDPTLRLNGVLGLVELAVMIGLVFLGIRAPARAPIVTAPRLAHGRAE
jgi:NADH-quinone oxidoreductase subunit H